MLHDLHDELASRHVTFCIVGAMRSCAICYGGRSGREDGQRRVGSGRSTGVLDEGKARERSGLRVERPPGP